MEAKLSSASTMSAASFATSVPAIPIATPMSAFISAGASFTPSPVTATTCPIRWSADTARSLCSGATRARITSPRSPRRGFRTAPGERQHAQAGVGHLVVFPGDPPPFLLRHRKVFSSGPHPGAALEHFSGRPLHEDGPASPLPAGRGHPFPPGIEGDLAPPRETIGKRFPVDLSFLGGHPQRRLGGIAQHLVFRGPVEGQKARVVA